MNDPYRRIRRGALAGALLLPMGMLTGVTAAHALVVVPCTVSLGVFQSATTVTGTPLSDTIDCSAASPGKTIYGLGGDDTLLSFERPASSRLSGSPVPDFSLAQAIL